MKEASVVKLYCTPDFDRSQNKTIVLFVFFSISLLIYIPTCFEPLRGFNKLYVFLGYMFLNIAKCP